jgi:hypothetical protein
MRGARGGVAVEDQNFFKSFSETYPRAGPAACDNAMHQLGNNAFQTFHVIQAVAGGVNVYRQRQDKVGQRPEPSLQEDDNDGL